MLVQWKPMGKVSKIWNNDSSIFEVKLYTILKIHIWYAFIVCTKIKHYIRCILHFSEYLGEEHNDIAFLCCRIGYSFLKLGRFSETNEYFERADNIYKYVPGISSSFYQTEFLSLLRLVTWLDLELIWHLIEKIRRMVQMRYFPYVNVFRM